MGSIELEFKYSETEAEYRERTFIPYGKIVDFNDVEIKTEPHFSSFGGYISRKVFNYVDDFIDTKQGIELRQWLDVFEF